MKKKLGITLAVVVLLVCVISVACFAACKQTVEVTKDNAQAATKTNWAEIDSKSAKTTISLSGVTISLADGDITISAGADITLDRKWEGGTLTIGVTAKPKDVTVDLGPLQGIAGSIISSKVNFEKLNDLTFTGEAFYNYGTDKTIGVRNMSVTGLKSAIPALTDKNITDAAWEIQFDTNGDGKWEKEVSTSLNGLNDLVTEGTVGGILSSIFPEDYTLDLVSIIEGLLVNQTMLDFSDTTNATFDGTTYQNKVSALDNLNFLMNVWNQINDDGREVIEFMLVGETGEDFIEIPVGDIDIPLGRILDALIPDLRNLVPSLLETLVTDGTMSVTGTVTDGYFSRLDTRITGVSINLTETNVEDLVEIITGLLTDAGVDLEGIGESIVDVIGGAASISLGTIQVNSTYTVA